eukprot:1080452-Pleurochrysis_carterae.AAC.2
MSARLPAISNYEMEKWPGRPRTTRGVVRPQAPVATAATRQHAHSASDGTVGGALGSGSLDGIGPSVCGATDDSRLALTKLNSRRGRACRCARFRFWSPRHARRLLGMLCPFEQHCTCRLPF